MAKKKRSRDRDDPDDILVPTTGGLKSKDFAKQGDDGRVRVKEGETVALQFKDKPTNKKVWKTFFVHQWKEGKNRFRWVPCLGEDICPLCDDEDDDISKQRKAFITPVYNFKTKKYEVLRGGANMAGKIALRFERLVKSGKEGLWTKKVWDLTAIPAAFTDYDLDRSDRRAIELDDDKLPNLDAWLRDRITDYYGNEIPTASSLDDDDDEDDDEDEDEEPRRKKKKKRK